MPQSNAARFGESSSKSASAPLQTREWDYLPTVKFPIGAPPTPLPGNGLVRARARVPDARSSKPTTSAEQVFPAKHSPKPSLRSLNLLTPSCPTLPPRANSAKVSDPSPRSVSPRPSRDWDSSASVARPIGSPASPLPEVSPQRDAVTFTLWKILAGDNRDILTSQDFYSGMQNVFPGEKHIAIQELWATMARSLGGHVTREQFQHFFEKSRPDFLFDQDRRHRLLQRHMTPMSSLSHQASQQHGSWIDLPKTRVSEREGRSVSPQLQQSQLFVYYNQSGAQDHSPTAPAASPRGAAADVLPNVAVTPADASARARELLVHSTDRAKVSQAPDSAGFKAVILHSSRAINAATPSQSRQKRDKPSSPKELKSARDSIRLQQYLAWVRTVLPSGDCESLGSDGSGLCNGLLLFKLIKAVGAPADRLHSLHLQMDQGVRTRRLWLRNMDAICNCVHACSSSICVLQPELAVDGDPGALVSILRLIVQTFIVKKIPKTRVIEWCAAHLQFFNITLQPQTIHFPHSNATLQQDFGDGLLLSLLLQRCIPAADEATGSEAMLLLQESELNSDAYSNRHIALALVITLGLPPYFTLQQLDLRPVEHNFIWMQLHSIYLAFSSALPPPSARAAAVESEASHVPGDQQAKASSSKEQNVERRAALQEKRALEAKSAELLQSVERLDSMKRTLRVIASPRSPRPSELIQQVKKTQARLQERSQELEETSSEISTVKQALAAVLQQQQEVQSLVQEHNALQAAHDSKGSPGDSEPAHTIQSFLEKVQRATLLEAAYSHRSKLLRAAAEALTPSLEHSSQADPQNPDLQAAIEQAEAGLREIEQFFLQQNGAQLSESSRLLIHAKRSQLQELQSQKKGRLQPEVLENIQTLLSSDQSLQHARNREAYLSSELEQLRQEQDAPASRLQPHAASASKSSRSGARVQFSAAGQHDEPSDIDLQIEVLSAEVLATQRLIQSKQRDGDADAAHALKDVLLRKQTRLSSLSSKYLSVAQRSTSAIFQRTSGECFSLFIISKGERNSSADVAAWRLFWQGLNVHFTSDFACTSQGSDADRSVEDAMAQVAAAMERSRAQRKFLFLFIGGPVAESDPRALRLHGGQRITFDRVHAWLGSLCQHECVVVFDTGGSAFAQTAIDASCVSNFNGSIISGCLGVVDAGEPCSAAHPLQHGTCSGMGLLSFTIIEALFSASTNLTCDELELLLSSIQTQQHLAPSVISTLPYLVPSWVMSVPALQRNSRSLYQAPQSSDKVYSSQSAAAAHPGDSGAAYVSHTLETQYPPVSPEGSPSQSADEMEPHPRHTVLDFSDDDDIRPDVAWRFEGF